MKITPYKFAWFSTLLLSVASASETKLPKENETKKTSSNPVAVQPLTPKTSVPQSSNALPDKEVKSAYLITQRHRELAQKHIDSMFAYEIAKNPAYTLTKKDIEIARKNPNSMFAMGVAMHLPKSEITEADIKSTRKSPAIKFNFGLNQNPNRPITKEDKKLVEEAFTSIDDNLSKYFAVLSKRKDYKIEGKEWELLEKYPDSFASYWMAQNLNLFDTKENQVKCSDLFTRHIFSSLGAGLGRNERFKITEDILKFAYKRPYVQGARALFGNPRRKITPMDRAFAILSRDHREAITQTTYPREIPAYTITNEDREIAKEFNNTVFAYKTTIDPRQHWTPDATQAIKDLEWANSAYAVGTFRNPLLAITNEHIEWAMKKENANTQAAFEIARRMSGEQFTEKVKEEVWAKLFDTRFGEGAAQNYFFATKGIETDEHLFTSGDLARIRTYSFTRVGGAAPLNPTFIPQEEDKKEAKSEFTKQTMYAFNMGRSENWGEITKDDEDFIVKNHKSQLTCGLAGNSNLVPSKRLREFAKKLATEDPNCSFLYELTKGPNFVKNLSKEESQEELKFALKNKNSQYARGYFENPELLITQEIKLILRQKEYSNSQAAIGAANNENYIVDDIGDRNFVRGIDDPANRNTWLALELVSRDIYLPELQDIEIVSKDRTSRFAFALR